jgi:hypothetical protein
MAQQVSNLFIVEYQEDVHHVFQRMGSYLRNTVRQKNNVVGSSTKFNVVGKGTASTKTRHGQVTPMNADRSLVTCTIEDWYAGDWNDDLDNAKQDTNEKDTISRQGAFALGRKADELIIAALNGVAAGQEGSFVLTNKSTVENSLLSMIEDLVANDVPMDGQIYGLLTPRAWSQAMKVDSFNSSDYVGPDGSSFKSGVAVATKFKDWNGVKWQAHTGLPGRGTATAETYVYHKTSVGFAMAKHFRNVASNPSVMADITWHGDHVAWFINHMFSAGACRIEDEGIVEYTIDDTAAIVSS